MKTYSYQLTVMLLFFLSVLSVSFTYPPLLTDSGRTGTVPESIGIIGTEKNTLFKSAFVTESLPSIEQPVRLTYRTERFDSKTYQTYRRALSGREPLFAYADSLDQKPSFVILEVMDRVSLQHELQTDVNTQTLDYIQVQPKSKIVTSLSVVVSEAVKTSISQADALYLTTTSEDRYEILLYRDKKLLGILPMGQMMPFDYKASSFCWKSNQKRKVELALITENSCRCPKNTYPTFQKATDKIKRISWN